MAGIAPYLDHYGYSVIGGFLLLENVGVPVIPGEFSMIAGAIYAGAGRLNVVAVGVIAVVAAFVGAEIGYLIGRFGGRALVLRYGRYVFIKPHHLERAEVVVDRYGGIVVVIARFIVGLRELNGIIAGITGMHWLRFMIYNAIGAVAWVAAWVSLGYLAGDHIPAIYANVQRYSLYVLIALVLAALAFIVRIILRRRRALPMTDSQLSGRTVVVFGAAGALGAGVVAAFAAAGASVTGADVTLPTGERRVDGAEYRAVSVLDDGALSAFFGERPPPWAVVNTVGGYAPYAPLAELDTETLTAQLELNLVSAALVTKHALRQMKKTGEGRIVHTASRAATSTEGTGFAYSVSKLGVLHLVTMAAAEARGTSITVNCVVPSIIDTPANRAAMPGADHGTWPQIPDIARSYLYLASPAAHLVNGAAIPV